MLCSPDDILQLYSGQKKPLHKYRGLAIHYVFLYPFNLGFTVVVGFTVAGFLSPFKVEANLMAS